MLNKQLKHAAETLCSKLDQPHEGQSVGTKYIACTQVDLTGQMIYSVDEASIFKILVRGIRNIFDPWLYRF